MTTSSLSRGRVVMSRRSAGDERVVLAVVAQVDQVAGVGTDREHAARCAARRAAQRHRRARPRRRRARRAPPRARGSVEQRRPPVARRRRGRRPSTVGAVGCGDVLGADDGAGFAPGHRPAGRRERERSAGDPQPDQHPPRPADAVEHAELAEAGEQRTAEQRQAAHDPAHRHRPQPEHREHRGERRALGGEDVTAGRVGRQRRQRGPELHGDERGEHPDPLGRDRPAVRGHPGALRRDHAHDDSPRPASRRVAPAPSPRSVLRTSLRRASSAAQKQWGAGAVDGRSRAGDGGDHVDRPPLGDRRRRAGHGAGQATTHPEAIADLVDHAAGRFDGHQQHPPAAVEHRLGVARSARRRQLDRRDRCRCWPSLGAPTVRRSTTIASPWVGRRLELAHHQLAEAGRRRPVHQVRRVAGDVRAHRPDRLAVGRVSRRSGFGQLAGQLLGEHGAARRDRADEQLPGQLDQSRPVGPQHPERRIGADVDADAPVHATVRDVERDPHDPGRHDVEHRGGGAGARRSTAPTPARPARARGSPARPPPGRWARRRPACAPGAPPAPATRRRRRVRRRARPTRTR